MENRNKRWRIEHRNRLYAAKMRVFAASGGEFILRDGERVWNPRWIDLYNANWCPRYKSMRTPCSCWMCRGEKYDRLAHKRETARIVAESEC